MSAEDTRSRSATRVVEVFAAEAVQRSVSVVVPTYREVENLPHLVPGISRAMVQAGRDFEIIIVDDDSRDGTREVVGTLAAENPVRLITRTGERGLAGAVVHGFDSARNDTLICMDADFSHPPSALSDLARALEHGAEFAVGSRYVKGGTTDEAWGLLRRLNSRVATALARPLVRLHDPMSGFFAITRERYLLARPHLRPVGYKIGLEILVRAGVDRCVEVPIHFRDRERGTSKMSLQQQVEYGVQVARLYAWRMRHHRRSSPEAALTHSDPGVFESRDRSVNDVRTQRDADH